MATKKIWLLSAGLALSIASCTWDIPLETNLPCVTDAIKYFKNTGAELYVWQYKLNGSLVYFVDERKTGLSDVGATLYDGQCNVICSIGGWDGSSCPDSIWNNLTDAKLLYAP